MRTHTASAPNLPDRPDVYAKYERTRVFFFKLWRRAPREKGNKSDFARHLISVNGFEMETAAVWRHTTPPKKASPRVPRRGFYNRLSVLPAINQHASLKHSSSFRARRALEL